MTRVSLFRDFITGSGILDAPTQKALNTIEARIKHQLQQDLPVGDYGGYTIGQLTQALCDWADLLTTASRVSTCPDVPHDYTNLYELAGITAENPDHPFSAAMAYDSIRTCHELYLHIASCLRFNEIRRMRADELDQQVQFAGVFGNNQPMAVA
jgi:hypothetical protein